MWIYSLYTDSFNSLALILLTIIGANEPKTKATNTQVPTGANLIIELVPSLRLNLSIV